MLIFKQKKKNKYFLVCGFHAQYQSIKLTSSTKHDQTRWKRWRKREKKTLNKKNNYGFVANENPLTVCILYKSFLISFIFPTLMPFAWHRSTQITLLSDEYSAGQNLFCYRIKICSTFGLFIQKMYRKATTFQKKKIYLKRHHRERERVYSVPKLIEIGCNENSSRKIWKVFGSVVLLHWICCSVPKFFGDIYIL